MSKCFFGFQEMEYMGYIVLVGKKVRFNKESRGRCRIACAYDAEGVKEVRNFVQFCNICARFIHHFSDLSAQVTSLLRKSQT
jgi:hypothetical protein